MFVLAIKMNNCVKSDQTPKYLQTNKESKGATRAAWMHSSSPHVPHIHHHMHKLNVTESGGAGMPMHTP